MMSATESSIALFRTSELGGKRYFSDSLKKKKDGFDMSKSLKSRRELYVQDKLT